jgi:hypothetical protein
MSVSTAVKTTENATRKAVKVSVRSHTIKVTDEQLALILEGLTSTRSKWRVLAGTPKSNIEALALLSGGASKALILDQVDNKGNVRRRKVAPLTAWKQASAEFMARHTLLEALKTLVK